MLFKTGKGRIEDRRRDAHTILLSGRTVSIPERFEHHDFKDLYTYIGRYNWYATRELKDYIDYRRGRKFTLYPDFYTGGIIDVSEYSDGQRGGRLVEHQPEGRAAGASPGAEAAAAPKVRAA